MTKKENQYVGFDIGGTNFKAGTLLVQQDTQHISTRLVNVKYTHSLAESGFDDSYRNLVNFIYEYISESPKETIGIGFPSVVTNDGHIPIAPNMPGWKNVPLRDKLTLDLRQKLGREIEILIENDANVAALAEMYIGNAAGLKSFIYITLGTGIGGSIIHQRHLMKGSTFSAGEIGHTVIDREAKHGTGPSYRKGVFESYAGKHAVRKHFLHLKSELGDDAKSLEDIEIKGIFDLSLEGDAVARQVIDTYINDLAIGFASAINLLGIPYLVIGGGISNSLLDYWDQLTEKVRERLLPSNLRALKIVHAYFQNDSGLIGAALMAKDYEENYHG
jgi:glucokinase